MWRCLLILFLFSSVAKGSIDSLERVAATSKDTVRIKLLLDISRKYRGHDLKKALSNAETALKESKELGSRIFEGRAYYTIGGTYRLIGKYDSAFAALYTAFSIMKEVGYDDGYVETANVLGLTHYANSEYDSAVYYYQIYLDYALKSNASQKLPIAYNNIANVYYTQKNYKMAIEYYDEAIKRTREIGKEEYLSTMIGNLGAIYDDMNEHEKAKQLFFQALHYAVKRDNPKQQGAAHNNLGVVYRAMSMLDSSLYHFRKSLDMNVVVGDLESEALALLNIGSLYTKMNQSSKALSVLNSALEKAKEIGDPILLRDIFRSLAEASDASGSFEKSTYYYQRSIALTDSIYNEENSRQINEMQAKYDTQKKESVIALLNKDKTLQEEKANKQRVILNAVALGLVLIIALSFVLFRSNKLQKKANEQLTLQKAEIENAYGLINIANLQITAKNQEITDSINYAKRIQLSIIPEKDKLKEYFKDSFIIFKPKDIVSGDFYWFGSIENKKVLAVADCTGHGVPGALMSMIGHEKLLEALAENNAADPAETLAILDKKVSKALRQDDSFESAKDGMDIALLFIDEINQSIQYAGANRPLLYFNQVTKELTSHKPTKSSIGGRTDSKNEFQSTELKYQAGDSVYLFSDGYADQIGGEKSKKLMSKNFLAKIISLSDKTLAVQGDELDLFFETWKGHHEQVDDVLVAGIKFNG